MVLATTFDDKGDWTVEQQFVLQMGSSYLLAHGIGTPLAKDAVTKVTVPATGEYNILVRTKNWTKHWSDGPTPGIFSVLIDGQSDGVTYGTESVNWYWQRGGKVTLMVMLGDAVVAKGVDAGAVVREAAKLINGGGGGQKFFATAGGKNPEGLQAAIDKAVALINEKLA